MAAHSAELGKVSELEANIQQVWFIQIFWNFHDIVVKKQ